MSNTTILVVDDEPQIRRVLQAALSSNSESEAKARPLIEAEFRKVLTSYLKGVLSEGEPAG